MIQPKTRLKIIDNSGGDIAECIHVYNKYKRRHGSLGDIIKVSIKKLKKKGNIRVKKGHLYLGLIVQTKKKFVFKSGNFKCFNQNSIILLSSQKKPLGTRINGFLDSELRYKKFLKPLLMGYRFI
jgi:large subunit ribosomal protein L14